MARKKTSSIELPSGAGLLAKRFPDVWECYAALGEASSKAGPLDLRTRRLVKIALAIGAGLEGATHSHVRRGRAEGISADDIRHIALLAVPTLGLPASVRAMTWIDDVRSKKRLGRRADFFPPW